MGRTVTVKITYDHDGDAESAKAAQRLIQADDAFRVLETVRQEIFRPARKHGYADCRVTELIAKIDAATEPGMSENLIGYLEEMFTEILDSYDLKA